MPMIFINHWRCRITRCRLSLALFQGQTEGKLREKNKEEEVSKETIEKERKKQRGKKKKKKRGKKGGKTPETCACSRVHRVSTDVLPIYFWHFGEDGISFDGLAEVSRLLFVVGDVGMAPNDKADEVMRDAWDVSRFRRKWLLRRSFIGRATQLGAFQN